jgi:hypothetical protein
MIAEHLGAILLTSSYSILAPRPRIRADSVRLMSLSAVDNLDILSTRNGVMIDFWLSEQY